MLRWLMASVLMLAALSPALSQAHGRFPETGQIAFHPTDPQQIVVRTTFGILLSRDGGASWRWICRQILNVSLIEDPFVALTGDDSLLVATFDGLLRSTDGACSWGFPSESLEGEVAYHMVNEPSDPAGALVVTSPGNRPNQVFRTADHGANWTATGAAIAEAGFLSERVAVAASEPQRLYVSGSHLPTETEERRPVMYRSDDAGSTWTPYPVLLADGERNIFLMAVHPTNPNRVFVRVSRERDNPGPERLLRSDDGGTTWVEALVMDEIRGMAFDDSGDRAWVGGWGDDSLYDSDNGGESFTSLGGELSIGCLAWRTGELWACAQNFTNGFAIASSGDGGQTFEPRLVFQDDIVGLVECPADSPTTVACEPALEDLTNDLALALDGSFPDSGMMPQPADAGMDAGMPPRADPGCGCSVESPQVPSGIGYTIFCLALLIEVRRRIGRPSHGQ